MEDRAENPIFLIQVQVKTTEWMERMKLKNDQRKFEMAY